MSQPVSHLDQLSPEAFALYFDHTLLRPTATTAEIEKLCEEASQGCFAAVCVNGFHLETVVRRLKNSAVLPIAVVGFPLGAMRSEDKASETRSLVSKGAKEIDMVLNLGAFLGGARQSAADDISLVVQAAGRVPVKVIIETAFLTPIQIVDATKLCLETNAAFVKTSTGFASRGASLEDIMVMKETIAKSGRTLKIKASGGIRTLDAALAMIKAGADRIGSSNSVALLEEFRK